MANYVVERHFHVWENRDTTWICRYINLDNSICNATLAPGTMNIPVEGVHTYSPEVVRKELEHERSERERYEREARDFAKDYGRLLRKFREPFIDVDKILESLGDEFMDPGDDPWGGANLDFKSYKDHED